jgi:hypothetical protein
MVTITAETQPHGSVDVQALMARWTESRRTLSRDVADASVGSVRKLLEL